MTRQPDYDRAANQAYRCLLRLKVSRLPVRPLSILRRCRNTAVYTYQQAAEQMELTEEEFERRCGDADAFTVRMDEKYVVCYRSGGNPARLNFTLAHELGHILLHHYEDHAAEEAEANCFATHLLCPEPAVQGMSPEQIAERCFVSKTAARLAARKREGCVNDELLSAVGGQMANEIVD